MVTPKNIIMKDLELADKEIARLRRENKGLEKENKELKKELKKYKHYYDRDKEELMESCYALAKENKQLKEERDELEKKTNMLKIELGMYQSLFKDKIEPYGCGICEKVTEEDVEKAIKKYLNTNQK